jgi:hypothetical protein
MGIFDKIKNIFKNPKKPTASIIASESRMVYDTNGILHAIPLTQWRDDMKMDEIKSFPLVNEPMTVFADSGMQIHPFGVPPPVDYSILWTYFKYTPEIIAIIRAIVEDIMSDGWNLEGGRNNRLKAEKFLMKNYAKEQIASMLFDALITGDGYLYVQRLSRMEVKGRIDSILGREEIKSMLGSDEIKHEMGTRIFDSLDMEEDIFTARSFIAVPSSTLKAKFDKNGNVSEWVQKVGARINKLSPDELIHFRLLRLDGKFYGFSPLASILKDMDILANVKDYARYFFEKGGVPNYLFIMPNETPDSPNYKNFQKTLQLFSSLANKYKNLIVTGEVEAKELNKLSKDMEFRELAKYLTQVLIMTWGVPVSRLSDVGLGDKVQARGSTVSTEGYYRKISYYQDILEDLINMELLAPFKVKMKFKKTYLQDEIREVQVAKIMTDTAEQRMSLGLWDREQAGKYLGMEKEDLPTKEDITEMRELMTNGGGTTPFGQSKMNNFQMLSESSEKIGQAADKQSAALNVKAISNVYGKKYPELDKLRKRREHPETEDRLDELEDKVDHLAKSL